MLKLITLIHVLSLTFIIPFSFSHKYEPVQAVSLTIDRSFISKSIQNGHGIISKPLTSKSQELKGCQIVSAISKINLQGEKQIEFSYSVKLNKERAQLDIEIHIKNVSKKQVTDSFVIVIDFLIARFLKDILIQHFNMTAKEQIVPYFNQNQYVISYFLNGWSRIQISNNIQTQCQQAICRVLSENDKWVQRNDYLMFTVLTAPKKYVKSLKKFDRNSLISFEQDFKYFYGLSGTVDPQFSAALVSQPNGISLQTASNKSFTVTLLLFPDKKFTDNRQSNTQTLSLTKIIVSTLLSFVLIFSVSFFVMRRWFLFRKNDRLNQQQTGNTTNPSAESSKNDLNLNGKCKYKISTVQQVDQNLESSFKGHQQGKADISVCKTPNIKGEIVPCESKD